MDRLTLWRRTKYENNIFFGVESGRPSSRFFHDSKGAYRKILNQLYGTNQSKMDSDYQIRYRSRLVVISPQTPIPFKKEKADHPFL